MKKELEDRLKEQQNLNEVIDLPFYADVWRSITEYPEKGLLLIGGVGTGKSALMRAILPDKSQMIMTSLLVHEYCERGQECFASQIMPSGMYHINGIICYDDLGTEPETASYMGNKRNVMADIIEGRYEIYKREKIMTYFTTNLGLKSIKKRYGERAFSRLREMVTEILIDGKDLRK